MVGLGGGLIYAPLFILLDFPVHTAFSASLFLNGIAALSAAITYYRKRMIDFHIGLPLIVSSTLFAPLGALLTAQIDLQVVKSILAVVMIAAALRMLFFGRPSAAAEAVSAGRRFLGGILIGATIGFIAGMLGIGGGRIYRSSVDLCSQSPGQTGGCHIDFHRGFFILQRIYGPCQTGAGRLELYPAGSCICHCRRSAGFPHHV